MNEQDLLILEWKEIQNKLSSLKDEELELRKQIHKLIFKETIETGTHKHNLGNGYSLKLTCKNNLKVDSADVVEQYAADYLSVFKKKYDLSMTEYNKLSDSEKKIVDRVLTFTPGTPSLELVEPKGK
jgi:hypothetical protein